VSGVTTLALALADRWPADVEAVVVEADPAGGDLTARFGLAPNRGLVSLAAAARRTHDPELLWEHLQRLPGGLAACPAPAGAEQARAVLAGLAGGGLAALRAAADYADVAVVADCGRLDPQSAALPLVLTADVLLLVVRPRDDELSQLAARLAVVAGWRPSAWHVVVAHQPDREGGYAVRDITRALGARVLGPVPHDPDAAAVLAGRRRSWTGVARSRLGRAAAELAGRLAAYADDGGADAGAGAGDGPPPAPATPAAALPVGAAGPAAHHLRVGTEAG
jgi:hypothetical protein